METNKNKIFTASNGTKMIESALFNWQIISPKEKNSDKSVHYFINVLGHRKDNCYDFWFIPKEGILNIVTEKETLTFSVGSFVVADHIVNFFLLGMKLNVDDTIYQIPKTKELKGP